MLVVETQSYRLTSFSTSSRRALQARIAARAHAAAQGRAVTPTPLSLHRRGPLPGGALRGEVKQAAAVTFPS